MPEYAVLYTLGGGQGKVASETYGQLNFHSHLC